MFLAKPQQKGFSLLEMALALLLVGILIQASISMLSQNQQRQTYKATEQTLQDIKQILLSYIQINQYLPCPDTDGDGLENRESAGDCSAHQGAFPYLEFGGVGQQDEFGNPFFYATNTNSTSTTSANNLRLACRSASVFANAGAITNEFYQCPDDLTMHCLSSQCNSHCATGCNLVERSRATTPYFNQITNPLGTSSSFLGSLRVCYDQTSECDGDTGFSLLAANLIPLTVISFGQNGAQTWQNCSQASNREQENCDGDRYFQQQPISQDFDDQLTWISMYEIKALLSQHINWHNE
ncbi:prepilin-type N-terminal cleavage/methylation domain-containing protein [Thiomicrospira sp.]|uniref:prepilin-type N-terminal cleavage/methylation domain-containing protein n=1 Tax=Thiomicrospira sp. TaxID=935 RepID=UPI002F953445